MHDEIKENCGGCSEGSCGCHVDIFATDQKCPQCGGRLRLAGRARTLEFRLACQGCNYQSPMLSREELGKVL